MKIYISKIHINTYEIIKRKNYTRNMRDFKLFYPRGIAIFFSNTFSQ